MVHYIVNSVHNITLYYDRKWGVLSKERGSTEPYFENTYPRSGGGISTIDY